MHFQFHTHPFISFSQERSIYINFRDCDIIFITILQMQRYTIVSSNMITNITIVSSNMITNITIVSSNMITNITIVSSNMITNIIIVSSNMITNIIIVSSKMITNIIIVSSNMITNIIIVSSNMITNSIIIIVKKKILLMLQMSFLQLYPLAENVIFLFLFLLLCCFVLFLLKYIFACVAWVNQ